MTNNFEHIAHHIYHIIKASRSILLIPHQKPDGDALGSTTGFAEWLTTEEKNYTIFCKTDYPKNFSYIPHTEEITTDPKIWEQTLFDTIVVFDSGDLRYAGVDELIQKHKERIKKELGPSAELKIIDIDHHATNEMYGDANLVATHFSSTCEAVFQFLNLNGIAINANMATSLLTGIITDTDHFTNSATSSTALETASILMSKSGKHRHIKETIYNNASLQAFQLWGVVFERLNKNSEFDIICTYVTKEDLEKFSLTETESEGMANFMNAIAEGKAGLIIKEIETGKWKGSFRTTRDDVDVARIAKALGGGGHKKAAGFTVSGTREQVFEQIFQVIRELGF
jgi:phosphoesterase RecJ-like protein